MKISLNWIQDYVDVDFPVSRIVDTLDNIGLLTEQWAERGEDIVLDIETYANRPDTLGHIGIARELAAALGLSLKEPDYPLVEMDEKGSDLVDVQIWDDDLCPRYCGMVVRDVRVGPSPRWLSARIEAMGLHPINNVVDVTNYVLFATAQPIHAFDLAKIAGRKVIIRRAKKGEKLLTLESREVDLLPDMLVIADEREPMALAGIIGGEESAVSDKTQDVFIESACFDPVSVRKTSKETGLQTDASYRFERGADISFAPRAACMAASLLTQIKGKVCRGIIDIYPQPRRVRTVMLRNHRVASLLGIEVDNSFVEKKLADLGFQVVKKQEGIWQVKIPQFRIDIEREADLIEEIARFFGYEKIPVQLPPLRTLETSLDPKKEKINKSRQLLFHYGFDEVVNFSFMDPAKADRFVSDLNPIRIRNPISTKAALLRTTLIGGLLETVSWNMNRGADGVHVFEIGNIFHQENEHYNEHLMLAMVMAGFKGERHWKQKDQKSDFFHLKGVCETLMEKLRYGPFSFREENHPYFQEGFCVALHFKGETIGFLGLLRKSIVEEFESKDKVWAAEINLDLLFEKQAQPFQYTPVAKFPSISRDISFIGDHGISYEEIRKAVEKLQLPHLEKFSLYDRYSGSSIPEDKVSLSFRFVFRHSSRTLQAEEVDALQEKLITALRSSFDFQLREGGKIDK